MGLLRNPVHFEAHKVLAYEHELNQLSKKPLKYVSDCSNSVVIEKQEASSTIARICVGPSCFDFMDDILLFSFFRDTIVFNEKGYNYGAGEQVEVKVLSTIVSRETCKLLDKEDSLDLLVEKKLEESIFIGKVDISSDDCPLKKGATVTSLKRCPVKSRFLTVGIDALIPIPEKLDVGEAAAVVSTYVPAMGMLHHGRVNHEHRCSTTSLKGLDILVTGGGTDEADAVINLALLSGANRVFVLQSKLSMATYHARSVRVELVSDNPREWQPVIDRYMDLIVDLEFPKNLDELYGILKCTGRLVCRKRPATTTGWYSSVHNLADELSLLNYPNASMYDVDDQIENEHSEMVRDIRHLFQLLASRRIRPKVDRYVTLREVEAIRHHMLYNPGSGAVVCEPWRNYHG